MIKDFNELKQKMSGHVPVYPEVQMPQTSAVLIPLLDRPDGISILFERRASTLRHQPGEICLPGGRMEPGESAVETAIRETCEELLIEPDQIETAGEMNGIMGPAGAPIWPVIGQLSDYRGSYSVNEVAEVFTVPVKWFMEHEAAVYKADMVTVPGDDFPYDLIPGGRDYSFRKKATEFYFYQTRSGVIWGLTAHVIHSFVQICLSS